MMQILDKTLLVKLTAIGIITFSLTTTGCAIVSLKNWFEQNGKVVYASNDKPVPNTIVAAVWRGTDTKKEKEGGGSVCYHVETTATDNEGKFIIPGWREYFEYSNLTEKKVSIVLYKPGFWTEEILLNAPTGSGERVYKIQAVSDSNRQTSSKNRLKYLQKLVGLTSCNVTSADRSKLETLYSKILGEAEEVAQTPLDKKMVKSLRNWTSFVASKN